MVHAHDWLVAHPAIALAEFFDVPMVSTVHATEAGRHSGWVSGRISRQVHAIESWFVRESDSLIACSASMADEISELFGPGLAEITVIRNGIDSSRWPFARRRRHAGPPELLFFGRLEYEKGVHEAIAALPRIRRTHPGTTLTIAGDGTQQEWLVEVARKAQGAQGGSTSSAVSTTTSCCGCCTAPTPRCCPAITSRSASSRSRPPRPASRWSPPTSADSARR